MTFKRHKMTFHLNILMMTLMFAGYVLTTGLEVITFDAAKAATRSLVALIAIFVIFEGRKIRFGVFISIYLIATLLVLNQNQIAANLLFLLVVVASMSRLSDKEAAVVFFVSSAAVVLLHIMLLKIGIVSASSVQVGDRERSALGFSNPNQFALVYLTLICSAFLMHLQDRTRQSFLIACGALALSLWMMQVAGSRTSMFSVAILLIFNFLWITLSKAKLTRQAFIWGMASIPIMACGITFFLATNNDPMLDIVLSFRPRLFAAFLSTVTWQDLLFGWVPDESITLDNGYLSLLSAVGAPVFVATILIMLRQLSITNPDLLPISGAILIASIFESFLIRPEIPLSVMFFYIILRKPDVESKNNLLLVRP